VYLFCYTHVSILLHIYSNISYSVFYDPFIFTNRHLLSFVPHRKILKKIVIKKRANSVQIVHIDISTILKPVPFGALPPQLSTQPLHSSSFCFKMLLHYFLYFYLSISSHKKARDTVCRDYTYLFTCSRLYQNLFPQISANSSRPKEREPHYLFSRKFLVDFEQVRIRAKAQQKLLLSSTIYLHTSILYIN